MMLLNRCDWVNCCNWSVLVEVIIGDGSCGICWGGRGGEGGCEGGAFNGGGAVLLGGEEGPLLALIDGGRGGKSGGVSWAVV